MTLLVVGLVVAGVVVLTPFADRLGVPQPVLLTVFGLLLALTPGLTAPNLEPDLILPVVLPPLLFAATQRSSVREFRESARPILVLAVGLTLASAAVVAVVVHALGLAWGPAWVLGAVVAPPDPVAATAVARRLRLPDRVVTVLEGEGMFNDATALVLYSVAVGAVVAGHVGVSDVAAAFGLAVGAGVAIGFAAGWLARRLIAALHDAAAETTVTIAMPFGAYLLAERVHGSGVLAVLVLGLFLRTFGHPAISSAGWLQGRSVWRYADFVITSAVFVLIGFELTSVLRTARPDGHLVAVGGATLAALVLLRIAWMYPGVAVARLRRRRRGAVGAPAGLSETTVVAWAGMRGVVTVATALALPDLTRAGSPFPERQAIVLVGLTIVLVTLVGQGLTLGPLVRRLGVADEGDPTLDVADLRRRAAQAALDAVPELAADEPEPVGRAVTLQYQGFLRAQEALEEARRDQTDVGDGDAMVERLESVLRRASEIERDVVLRARSLGEVSAAVTDEVLQDVEARANRDLG
jgi:Na+/H+ antiporter